MARSRNKSPGARPPQEDYQSRKRIPRPPQEHIPHSPRCCMEGRPVRLCWPEGQKTQFSQPLGAADQCRGSGA